MTRSGDEGRAPVRRGLVSSGGRFGAVLLDLDGCLIDSNGFHGVALPSEDPERDARAWSAVLSLPILRRSRDEVVLGLGPELFVSLVRSARGTRRPPELHLAVKDLRARDAAPDLPGGDGVVYAFGAARLFVREFRRPPSRRWASPRPPSGERSRRSDTARAPSSGAGNRKPESAARPPSSRRRPRPRAKRREG